MPDVYCVLLQRLFTCREDRNPVVTHEQVETRPLARRLQNPRIRATRVIIEAVQEFYSVKTDPSQCPGIVILFLEFI